MKMSLTENTCARPRFSSETYSRSVPYHPRAVAFSLRYCVSRRFSLANLFFVMSISCVLYSGSLFRMTAAYQQKCMLGQVVMIAMKAIIKRLSENMRNSAGILSNFLRSIYMRCLRFAYNSIF